ncbi:MAG: hypothetical protein WCE58_02220 [Gallionella sp.]
MKSKWLNRSLLTSPYYYKLCLTEKDFTKTLTDELEMPASHQPRFHTGRDSGATTHEFQHNDGEAQIIIVCMHPVADRTIIETYALLVHEAVHVWQYIASAIGERYPGDEEESYAVQRISLELFGSYDEQMASRKKRRAK